MSDYENSPKVPRSARRLSGVSVTEPSGERVKVVVRVRPPQGEETGGGCDVERSGRRLKLHRGTATQPFSEFDFDQVLDESAAQADVYNAAVKPIVEDVMAGYNGTIMAYGQTGAGKTFTLSSIQPDAIGMMPRAAAEVFNAVAADPLHEYAVFMSYIQIYMELIQDLLQPQNENMQIREGANGVFVEGVHETEVRSTEDCLRLLQMGDRNRVFAFTKLNAHSSRSHAIVMLTVIKRQRLADPDWPDAEALPVQRMKIGKLFLVDLAGSERLKKSRSTGLRATEARSINLSLTTLGMCINARADPTRPHVPFRDSKLTRLLQEALGGNAKTSLVIAVANAKEHVDESLQSLQFGSRAMHVATAAVVNEHADLKLVNAELASAMEQHIDSGGILSASLLARQEELESANARLRGEKDAHAQIMANLNAEREAAEAEQQRKLQEHLAALQAEKQQSKQLEQQLQRHQTDAQDLIKAHRSEKKALQSELSTLRTAIGTAEAEKDQALSQLQKEHDALQQQHNSLQAQMRKQAREEKEAANQRHVRQVAELEARLKEMQDTEAQLQQEMERCQSQYQEQLHETQVSALENFALVGCSH
ncbi:hypothetical protein WJX84_005315 [Apatococcus fuscideae]|uniref:Kinesin-like protein n=1 Tax=Apatococcus fuscideae TaxID=2026836 RepID=A0AAW1SQE5_9CHLO